MTVGQTFWNDDLTTCFPTAANHRLLERHEEEALGRELQGATREIITLACEVPLVARYLLAAWVRHTEGGGAASVFVAEKRSAPQLARAMARVRRALARVDAARREDQRARVRRQLTRAVHDADLGFEQFEASVEHLRLRARALDEARRTRDRAEVVRIVKDFGVPARSILPKLQGLNEAAARRESARAEFVLHNLRLVALEVSRYRNSGVPFDDLMQEGVLGLMRAAEKFDPERGFRFSTYAVWWIRQAVGRGFERQGRTIRLPYNAHARLRHILNAGARTRALEGREPSTEEIARETELAVSDVEASLEQLRPIVSLDGGSAVDDPPLIERLGEEVDPTSEADQLRIGRLLGNVLDRVPEREADVVRRRFGLDGCEPQSLAEIGRSEGISRERTRQIERRALERIREVLGEAREWNAIAPVEEK